MLKSNIIGVSYVKRGKKWRFKRYDNVEYFNSKEEAENVALKYEESRCLKIAKMLKNYNVESDDLNSHANWVRCLDWDITTGLMTWKANPNAFDPRTKTWETKFVGKLAFNTNHGNGYLQGEFLKIGYKAHRVIWFLEFGEWPDGEIDHINRITTDNRLVNLRCVTHQDNMRNRFILSDKVEFSNIQETKNGKFKVRVTDNEGNRPQITYDTAEEAVRKRDECFEDLGYHFNHGRIPD